MDCDFSHDPEDVPRLLSEIEKGADFVIISRYVPGGKIPEEWKLWRKANSFFGNLVARMVAGIYPVRDCTAGFRAIRTSMLRQVDFDSIKTQGYGFQVSLLHACYVLGAKVREVPVLFTDRAYGESKLGLKDIIEFIQMPLQSVCAVWNVLSNLVRLACQGLPLISSSSGCLEILVFKII